MLKHRRTIALAIVALLLMLALAAPALASLTSRFDLSTGLTFYNAVTGGNVFAVSPATTGDRLTTTLADAAGASYATTVDSAGAVVQRLYSDGHLYSGTSYQPKVVYTAISATAATLNADDGTGIKLASIQVPYNALLLRAWVNVTQGSGDAGDTIDLIINDADSGATPVYTLLEAQECASVTAAVYSPANAHIWPTFSATNKYLVTIFKDVGNDAGATTTLTGSLGVEYLRQ